MVSFNKGARKEWAKGPEERENIPLAVSETQVRSTSRAARAWEDTQEHSVGDDSAHPMPS